MAARAAMLMGAERVVVIDRYDNRLEQVRTHIGAETLDYEEVDVPGYVRLAFDEIRLAGAASPQVTSRLSAALRDLKSVAPPDRQARRAPGLGRAGRRRAGRRAHPGVAASSTSCPIGGSWPIRQLPPRR
jgi:hypothetical protein